MAYIPQSGSVRAFQGTVPWSVLGATTNIGSVITVNQGSIAAVIIGGSVAASFTPTANQSVSGTVGASVIGLTPVSVSNFPATQVVAPNNSSLFALQPAGSILAVSGTFTPATNQSVSGTVGASVIGTVPVTQSGINITSLVSTVPSSVIVGASIFGALPPVTIGGGVSSVALVGANTVSVVGSITAYQGAAPYITNFQNSSILAVPVGSVITVIQANSIAGTYAEDAGHTTGDRGLLHLGVRNDTGSVLTNADLDYTSFSTDSAGQVRVTNGNSWIPSVYAVLSSLTSISIMNANQNRKGGTIYNNAGTPVFVKLGTAATTSVYTLAMQSNDYYELPFGYVGVVAGISASNAGIINVTEVT